MKEITKDVFEHYVPAFRTPAPAEENTVWAALQTHIETAKYDVDARYGEELPEQVDNNVARLVCLMAARRALAGVDIVLTQTGFGVVSNQNLAPASRDRVQALAEQLRREESRAADSLAFILLKDENWANSTEADLLVNSLLWCPTLLRRCGITAPDRREVYTEEMQTMIPRIREAELALERVISPELTEELVKRQRSTENDGKKVYTLLAEFARRFLAAYIMSEHYPRETKDAARRLLDLVRKSADELPEWQLSAVKEAEEMPRYDNRKSDPCFFF